MTRTIDAYLDSTLTNNRGSRYFKCFIRPSASSTSTTVEMEVLSFRLSATEMWIKAKYTLAAAAADQYFVCLRRGVLGDADPADQHIDHYLDTGNFEIVSTYYFFETSNVYTGAVIEIRAELFARRKVVLAADVSYETLITNYCAAVGKTPLFGAPARDMWAYQFEKTGTVLTIETGRQFLSLLRSKYFIFACDAGDTDDVYFYTAYEPPSSSTENYNKTVEVRIEQEQFPNLYTKYITLMYEDETGAVTDYTPNGTYPYLDQAFRYYIGYLESTDKTPSIYRDELTQLRLVNIISNRLTPVEALPDLEMRQGDCVHLTGKNGVSFYIWLDHIEYLDRSKKPAWGYLLKSLERISNTAAGFLPADVFTHGNNIPLNVTRFDGILSDMDTTIQRAMETIDDHSHGSGAPAAHAASHQDGGSDETGYTTPGAFRLPKADATGKLTAWIDAATEAAAGIAELATSAETDAGKVVQASDTRLSDARTPSAHAASHAPGGSDAVGSLVSDAAYGAGWNGVTDVAPSKNAVYDKINSLSTTFSPDGWVPDANTWSFSSADNPTYVISINADMTGVLSPGMKIKYTQTTQRYAIITAVGSYSGGATLITVYCGTAYSVADAAITDTYYSTARAPLGFPLNPDWWTVTMSDISSRSQATPTSGTWYNPGSLTISIPIGMWIVNYQAMIQVNDSTSGGWMGASTLSTANNTESDSQLTAVFGQTSTTNLYIPVFREKLMNIEVKTSYYLNVKTYQSNLDTIYVRGDLSKTVVMARCAYL